MRDRLRSYFEQTSTERLIVVLVILNAIVLGLETSPAVTAVAGPLLAVLDRAFLALFTVEILLRLTALGPSRYARDPWNVFDFIVIGISWIPATGPLQVVRALRVLRVLRVISAVPSLRRVVTSLINALPGIGSIALLLCLLYYVFAVMATQLYGEDFPELFGSLPASAFTLFTIMTLEGWVDGVVKPVMAKHPYAWMFFIPYILVTTFTVLNLFIAIIVSAMQSEHEATRRAEEEAHRKERLALGSIGAMEHELLHEIRELRAEVKALRDGKKDARRRR